MALETTLLQLLKYRERHDRLMKSVPMHVLDTTSQIILKDYTKYFREFPDVQKIESASFTTWFISFAHPKLNDDARANFKTLLKCIDKDCPPELEAGLAERLVAANVASKITDLVNRWNEGDEADLFSAMRGLVEDFEMQTNRKVKLPWVDDDITDLLKADENDTGLHWRLSCLNMAMRPLRGGDFGIVAARPDKGKTTFLTSELTYMAAQVEALYPGEQRYILWLNNEGPGKRIITRMYQSALNETTPGLVKRSQDGTVKADYAKAVGGRADIIRVFDVHDFFNHELEDIIRNNPPALIVFDMIDNVKFGGATANGGQRTDQFLEAMYQWARIIAVKYDVPCLATSQVPDDGDGLQYPTLGMLKDSRTGKQGAAEFIVTIGASNDPVMDGSRFIGLTKNKLQRAGHPKNPRCEVVFNAERARFEMPE